MAEEENNYPWAQKVDELHHRVMAMNIGEIEERLKYLDTITGSGMTLMIIVEIGYLAERVNQLSW